MATIEARGYVSRPEVKVTKGGKTCVRFGLGVKQKEKAWGDKPESVTWANFAVTDFKGTTAPAEKAFVTVKGYLKVRKYTKDGTERTALEVNATEVEVSEAFGNQNGPLPETTTKAPKPAAKEPWDDDAEMIPF